jgi:hypothetical protein
MRVCFHAASPRSDVLGRPSHARRQSFFLGICGAAFGVQRFLDSAWLSCHDADAIASSALRLIEGGIGSGNQLFERFFFVRS